MTSDILSHKKIMKTYNPLQNKSIHIMTKYELAKIIGLRMEQLAHNAPSLVDIDSLDLDNLTSHEKYKKIVDIEIKERKIPFIIARNMPNGEKEYWKLSDMIIPGY